MNLFDWVLTPFSASYVIIASILLGVAVVTFGSHTHLVSRPLGWFLLSISLWALTAALDMASVSYSAKLFWSKIEYIGIFSSPVFLFQFFYPFTTAGKTLSPKAIGMLWIIPILTILLAFTNEWQFLEVTWRFTTMESGFGLPVLSFICC